MESARKTALTTLGKALAKPTSWLAGPFAEDFVAARAEASKQLQKYKAQPKRGPVVVAQADSAAYLAGVLSAVALQLPVVLANPRWGEVEGAQAAIQIKPGLWLGSKQDCWPNLKPAGDFEVTAWPGAILIPTGGTGGRVRWAIHDWATLTAAAQALAKFLDAENCTHVSTLPPCHVSGLMPAVRAIATGGRLWLENWKTLEAGAAPALSPERTIISLVPTQLQRLLKKFSVTEWLRHTHAILLGGAPASVDLLKQARRLRLPIALAYGTTETAAVVAAQLPHDFLAGWAPRFTPLPHAKITTNHDGRIIIQAKSLFGGYYPAHQRRRSFATEDLGRLHARGRLELRGRIDRVIITGGEKIHPAEVEKRIRATGLVKDVRVIGQPDAEWGERVVALYTGPRRTSRVLHAAMQGKHPPAMIPKLWLHTDSLLTDARSLAKSGW
jgi:O-succinylbenzoic acid--CoA ligase